MNAKTLGLLIIGMLAVWASAEAEPVTYTMTETGDIYAASMGPLGGGFTGQLGSFQFGSNDVLTLTFVGDTSNVIAFTTPNPNSASGYEILAGTATVSVTAAGSGTVLAHGTFLSSDGIFVSIDNTNVGLGFGSFGSLPSASGFPGQVHYPLAFTARTTLDYPPIPPHDPAAATYDLQSGASFVGFAESCVDFPQPSGGCGTGAPIHLATTSGDLVLNYGDPAFGTFTAVVGPTTVPEPATIALLGLGLAVFGFARRKS